MTHGIISGARYVFAVVNSTWLGGKFGCTMLDVKVTIHGGFTRLTT
jgi:hypothetical protein